MLIHHTHRRKLSMTSLIDVIFLLLLFFMLSSTFSRFGEIKMNIGSASGTAQIADTAHILFIRLSDIGISVNGQMVPEDHLKKTLIASIKDETHLVLSVSKGTNSQSFMNALHIATRLPNIKVTVVR